MADTAQADSHRFSPSRQLWLWVPPVLEMVVIFISSSISQLPQPPLGLTDKGWHVIAYGVLAALLLRALAGGRWTGVRLSTACLAAAIATLYSVTDEAHQYFVPGRFLSLIDLFADAIGASAAAIGLWAWSIIRRQPR